MGRLKRVSLAALVAWAAAPRARADLASELLEMTGARTRVVWVHAVDGKPGGHWDALSEEYELMAFDTADAHRRGGRPRVLLPGPARYACPWITPNGKRVVFTAKTRGADEVHVVDWDGRNRRRIAPGFGLCVWADPKDGTEWVYVSDRAYGRVIHRYPIDKPAARELVWRGPVSIRFRVSADGTRAGSEWNWPKAGVANLAAGTWRQYGSGCNAMLAPDNSYRFFHMGEQAGHRGVVMYDAGGTNRRVVWFEGLPGRTGREGCWASRWSSEARFLTISSPAAGRHAEAYLGRFDSRFTRIEKWVRITRRPGQDAYAYVWVEPGLGRYFGEAPLTVTVPPDLAPGRWHWDYGDLPAGQVGGARRKSALGKHTYTKQGRYTITARREGKVLKGWVNVHKGSAPVATAARLLDETHVRVTFNEPVRLKDAAVSLASGAGVKGFRLRPDGVELTVELRERPARGEALILQGVRDRAAAPNRMRQNRVPIERPSWPSSRSDLAFLWETARGSNIRFDAAGRDFRAATLTWIGTVRTNRVGAMDLRKGGIVAAGAGAGIVELCRKSGELTIEATITPAAGRRGRSRPPASAPAGPSPTILGCDQSAGARRGMAFALCQEGPALVLYLRTTTAKSKDGRSGDVHRVMLCALERGKAHHCVVSYRPGDLRFFLNGRQVKRIAEVRGTLSWDRPPADAEVYFGQVMRGRPLRGSRWHGTLEGVAIWARAIGPQHARKDHAEYAARLRARTLLPKIRLRGRLLAKSSVPHPNEIAPYDSALVVYEYEVREVLAGKYGRERIRVAHWALRDGRRTPIARAKPGRTRTLLLEKFGDHPELEDQVLRDTLAEALDLPLYVEAEGAP